MLAVPPKDEQSALAAYLQQRVAQFSRLAAAIEKHLGNLNEYRSALITNAVTGKIDVRGEVEKEAAA
jgi:type I restriction enzyme S subunit